MAEQKLSADLLCSMKQDPLSYQNVACKNDLRCVRVRACISKTKINNYLCHCVSSEKCEVYKTPPVFIAGTWTWWHHFIDHVTYLPAPDGSWTAFLFVWGNHCRYLTTSQPPMITPSGSLVDVCVCVSDVTSGHSSCVISPIQWYTHQTSEGLRLYWGCDIKSILLQGSTIKTACVFVSVRMSLCRFVCTRSYSHLFVGVCGFAFMYARAVAWGNKEIRHREGALKSSPTSQCHSNSLHLTRRNHNRGSRGIPHWHMTDTARLKGNSTPKRILCTGGMQGKHLLVAKTTQDKSRVYSVI